MARRKKVVIVKSVEDALKDAAPDIEELKDEMVEWQENMESADMEHLPKYDEVNEAAETLENADLENAVEQLVEALSEKDPEALEEQVSVTLFTPYSRPPSRATRLEMALAPARAAVDKVRERQNREKPRDVDDVIEGGAV